MEVISSRTLVKVSLGLNFFCLLAILYLFNNQPKSTATVAKVAKTDSSSISIAYVNVDTILSQYDLIDDLTKNFEQQRTNMQQQLYAQQEKFEKDVIAFQQNAQSGKYSADQAQKQEQSLQRRQQELMTLEQRYSSQLAQKEMDMRQHIIDSVVNYLNRQYSNQYDYILGYTTGGGILYTNQSYDLTSQVLSDLQSEYTKAKK